MDLLLKIKTQLAQMSESKKDTWLLSQIKLLPEETQEGILQSLTGVKKIIDMPTTEEIDKFCERAENGEFYFEYETHYYEFDDDGRYMNDWKIWHNDIFHVIPFLDRVFAGCHDLLRLEEYEDVSKILGRVCELQFPVTKSEDSEDDPEMDIFTLLEADEEGMFQKELSDAGEDWIRAVTRLTEGQDDRRRGQKLLQMFEHPVCLKVKPRILSEEGLSQEMFTDMAAILEREIVDLELLIEKKSRENACYREIYKMRSALDRKREILLDIRVKCLKVISTNTRQDVSKLEASWKQILEGIKWLSYEKYIDDQPEIDEIQDICEALISHGQLGQEDWKVRKKVLKDIIHNRYYESYNCGDIMEELAEKLCTNQEEFLSCADIMDATHSYKEKAAYLYYKYGKEDKYVSYLEANLGRRSKEYAALITYYQEHCRQEDARRVAELGLERCREDLTDSFICLLSEAHKSGDQNRYKKLYASAKRRKHVDIEKINKALKDLD